MDGWKMSVGRRKIVVEEGEVLWKEEGNGMKKIRE